MQQGVGIGAQAQRCQSARQLLIEEAVDPLQFAILVINNPER